MGMSDSEKKQKVLATASCGSSVAGAAQTYYNMIMPAAPGDFVESFPVPLLRLSACTGSAADCLFIFF